MCFPHLTHVVPLSPDSLVGDHARAMKLYLQCGDTHIGDAIDMVKKAHGQPGSELLVRMLHDFLIGETDGKVKDLNFVFRLYMAIGQYSEGEERNGATDSTRHTTHTRQTDGAPVCGYPCSVCSCACLLPCSQLPPLPS